MTQKTRILLRSTLLWIFDGFASAAAIVVAFIIRFDGNVPPVWENAYAEIIPPVVISTLLMCGVFKLNKSLWRYASIAELVDVVKATASSDALCATVLTFMGFKLPRSIFVLYPIFLLIFIGGGRFAYRLFRQFRLGGLELNVQNVMIIGAGDAGSMLIKEIQNSANVNKNAVCVIDDDNMKLGKTIHGVPVVGSRSNILDSVKKYNIKEIYIALPSADKGQIKRILDICKETKCKLQILPGIYQLISQNAFANLREVQIEDLLGREPITVELGEIMGYISNKVVVVTGGGGSIGSELCRQIAKVNPKQLIIIDIYENNAYDIQNELLRSNPDLDLVVLIASVRELARIDEIFEKYRPNIVFHAAAHKHVPLMEVSPKEAVKNNVFGTYNVAKTADKYGVERFVLISTDKAVNPTNIMGATKRLCEMIVQTQGRKSKTQFVAVRFGNVLGSNGSVIPLFKKQIEKGGPVTVTHPDIIRYFMTIPEAVSLVLQTGAFAKGGEIFVLDMGDPVKIVDLATNLIKLSGYQPNVDIMIEFTGLRPGEKLFEELLMDEEGMRKTRNKLIYIGSPIKFDADLFEEQLETLRADAYNPEKDIKQSVAAIVDTYKITNN